MNPDEEQLSALDQVEKEDHAIVFLYKANTQKYGKLVEEM